MTTTCANPYCQNQRRKISKYCSEACINTVRNDLRRARYICKPQPLVYKVDHKTNPIRAQGMHSVRRVQIVDDHVADPYFISRAELERNAEIYLAMDGLQIFVDGKPYDKQLVLI